MKKIILIILMLLVVGCSNTQSDTKSHGDIQREFRYRTIQRCFDTGGMPLFSAWDGSVMKDCEYPPTVSP